MLDGQTLWSALPKPLATLATANSRQRRREDARTIRHLLASNADLQRHNLRLTQALTSLNPRPADPESQLLSADLQAFCRYPDLWPPMPAGTAQRLSSLPCADPDGPVSMAPYQWPLPWHSQPRPPIPLLSDLPPGPTGPMA